MSAPAHTSDAPAGAPSGSTHEVVLVHGGAGTVGKALREGAVAGTRRAAQAGRDVLRAGGSAMEAAVAAVRVLEQHPGFNAGHGSTLNRDGYVEVDAAVMVGDTLRAGGVAGVRDLADAIMVAREVLLHTPHNLLVGENAAAFARERGVGHFGRDAVWTQKAQRSWDRVREGKMNKDNRADTVGALVRDKTGLLCAAGSTGGTLFKLPGRVGDTPMMGAGYFADNRLGAAVATGVGEAIMRGVTCYALLRDLQSQAQLRAREQLDALGLDPKLQSIAQATCEACSEGGKYAIGVLALTPDGRPVVAHTGEHMSWALALDDREIVGGLGLRDGLALT